VAASADKTHFASLSDTPISWSGAAATFEDLKIFFNRTGISIGKATSGQTRVIAEMSNPVGLT
jgi:hypothetical protein